jgi:SAM-dependent methyltransferase
MFLTHLFRRKPKTPTSSSAASGLVSNERHLRDTYLLPRNAREIDRLDMQHYLLRQGFKSNVLAPIGPAPRTILDVGCGTGRWAQELALTFPSAQVVGLDSDPTKQKRLPEVGESYQYVEANLLSGLPFADHTFDYTHQRLLVAGIPAKQWPFVIGELARVTSIGGWVEVVEAGNIFLNAGPATTRFLDWWQAFSLSKGIDASMVEHLGPLLERVGLHNVQTRTLQLPVGDWNSGEQRRLGTLLALDMLTGFPGIKRPCCDLLHLDPAAFDAVMEELPREWARLHTSYQFYAAWGQRW